jgi:hypothetical protein
MKTSRQMNIITKQPATSSSKRKKKVAETVNVDDTKEKTSCCVGRGRKRKVNEVEKRDPYPKRGEH